MSKDYERLARVQPRSVKLYDESLLVIARSLPPTDARRQRYASLLAQLESDTRSSAEALLSMRQDLEDDALRWTAQADA